MGLPKYYSHLTGGTNRTENQKQPQKHKIPLTAHEKNVTMLLSTLCYSYKVIPLVSQS